MEVRWIALGTAHAIATSKSANTHFVCVDDQDLILVDCPDLALLRLQQHHLPPQRLRALVLTHFHPDHVSGVPLLLMDLWLLGRTAPLDIYGLDHTLTRLEILLDLYGWRAWPGFYPVHFHRIPGDLSAPFLQTQHTRWFALPVRHMIPALGLRVEMPTWGQTLAYSGDTGPCPEVVQLARGADVLFHEATGEGTGHSSAEQAGSIAAEAGVSALYLVHTDPHRRAELAQRAQSTFSGPVVVAEDGLTLRFPLE